jgi:hypothetical protein
LASRLWGGVTERLPLKFAALFFALLLWVIVSAEEPTDEWVAVRSIVTVDSTFALADSVPRVQAQVVGRGRELLKLYTTAPEVRRAAPVEGDSVVTLELRPSDVDLPPGVDAHVRDVRPRLLRLHVRRLVGRTAHARDSLETNISTGAVRSERKHPAGASR